MVAFGRPKGYRGSYRQWEEGGVAPQVVFEVLPPGNTMPELLRKLNFYQRHGVDECYYLGPEDDTAAGWQRQGEEFADVPDMNGWASPRLGIRFQAEAGELTLFGPDGRPFRTWAELARERDGEHQRAERLAARLRALGENPDSPH
jgi:hypothetical protein